MVPERYEERWKQVHDCARQLYASQPTPADTWREPFQLLTAAFLYHKQAVAGLPADQFHVRHYDPEASWQRFGGVFEYEEVPGPTWGMDFASAAFRLSTAIFLVHKHVLGGHSLFTSLTREGDWERDKGLRPHLKSTSKLTCCKVGNFTQFTTEDSLRICAAMIVAHRDVFGHGETGEGSSKWWVKNRERYYRAFYQCQLAEAQLRLIEWGFSVLPM